jgi:predicted extracellular nuclease
MDKRTSRLLAAAVLTLAAAGSAQAQVVISQVYGGGGNNGARYKSDFIELHNNGASAVDLSGWSVQYNSSAGTGAWQRTTLTGSIAPGGYYLVKQADGTGGTDVLPTPDVVGTIAMSGTSGKVALVNNATALSGACPAGRIDTVGFGGAATCSEGTPTANTANATGAVRKNNGCTDTDNNSADFDIVEPTPRNSAAPAFACAGGNQPVLSVADVSLDEGNSGTVSFVFNLSLSQPAGAGGVAWSASTVDGTATAGSDYVALTGATDTIAEGQSSGTVTVTVNGDAVQEPNETFQLRVQVTSGGLPAPPAFAQATATIANDDVTLVPIHDIQGNGATSPLTGQTVTFQGVVTGRKSNGFFVQASDAEADADPATSEGIYVFTSTAPTAAATVGNRVRVSGTVVEFIPTADLGQLPLTEISFATYTQTGTDTLPVPVVLPQVLPTSPLDALERFESMRVAIDSFTVTAPTKGSTNEPNATGTSNGIFHGVIGSVPRPFREPGIQPGTPIPGGGTSPPIPRWDGNAELMTVDSDALGAPKLEVANGAVITGMTGPLDYGFRRYTLLIDPGATVNVTPGPAPHAAVDTVDPNAVSVAGYNLERFFDTVNDPAIGEPILTAAAYELRKKKASLGIRDFLKTPDILGTVEVENLTVLQDLAARINADAVAAGQPNPNYVAYLMEGNDVGGIDVGYLVKTGEVLPGKPRVQVVSVTQIGKDTLWTEPAGGSSLLNDRPPLALDAIVHYADGRDFPLSVVVVHQRSLNGAETDDADGQRIRAKRQRQAEFLATYLNQRQTDNPSTRLIVLGDFNAFEFNDGYVDAMNVVTGTPSADNTTVVPGDGADLVNPDLINLASITEPSERYSFVFDGMAQSLDHVLVNEEMVVSTSRIVPAHARINADFPEVNRNLADSPSRLSDHDPVVTYLFPREVADVSVAATANAASVQVGQSYGYSVVASNLGPGRADSVGVGIALDAEVPSLSVTAPNADWTCDTAQIANGKTSVACSATGLALNASATFAVSATATADLAGKTVKLAVAGSTTSQDPVAANDSAEASVAIVAAGPPATPISNGQSVLVSGAANEARVYRIDVPAGARNLRIVTVGGSGDIALYAKRGSAPTASDYDQRSIRTGNNEVILIGAPQAGSWFITVLGGSTAFANVSLRPSFVP